MILCLAAAPFVKTEEVKTNIAQVVRVISIMRSKGINIEVMGGLTQTDLLKDSKGEKLPPAAALVPVRQIEDLLGYFAGLLSVNRNQVFPIIPYAASEDDALVVRRGDGLCGPAWPCLLSPGTGHRPREPHACFFRQQNTLCAELMAALLDKSYRTHPARQAAHRAAQAAQAAQAKGTKG